VSKSTKNLISAFFVLLFFGLAHGQVSLNSLFGDNMVIQRDSEVCVWGKAEPGEVVSVSTTLNRKSKKTIADTKGDWQTFIKTPTAGKKFELFAKGQSNSVVIKNIIAGDIWVCAGQSNMGFNAHGDSQADKIFKLAAKYPNIRFFQRPNQGTDSPAEDVNGRWQVCDPETVKMF
jgi:sialate O-acetylesterase